MRPLLAVAVPLSVSLSASCAGSSGTKPNHSPDTGSMSPRDARPDSQPGDGSRDGPGHQSEDASSDGSAEGGSATSIAIGEFSGDSFGATPDSLDDYISLVGKKPVYGMVTEGWEYPLYYSSTQASFTAHDVTAIITWSPGSTLDGSDFSLANVLSGSYDAIFDAAAAKAAAWSGTLYIRMMHEMNGSWSSYAPGINGNTAEQFVLAWQYVVRRFRSDGVTNVRWVWSPNVVNTSSEVPFAPLYPGDAYVDAVGLDGYNFGNPDDAWMTPSEVFLSSYTELASLTSKPLWIAEWGCGEDGGNKAAWITDFFFTVIPTQMPRVRAVVVWNEDGSGDSATLALNSSAASLSAYESVLASPLYGGL
jgi:hypothetical protein